MLRNIFQKQHIGGFSTKKLKSEIHTHKLLNLYENRCKLQQQNMQWQFIQFSIQAPTVERLDNISYYLAMQYNY